MELGAEISKKVKKTIKKQLQTLGSYVDDELPEYIMVMIANKRTKAQMIEDLNLFLNDEADKFVSWLFVVLEHIQKAMQLPDIDALVESGQELNEKKKKKTKKEQAVESDHKQDEQKQKLSADHKQRQFRESKNNNDEEEEERSRKKEQQEQKERGRDERKREREEIERQKREEERKKRDEERKKRDEERKRKEEERKLEIEKRQRLREQRNKERKMKEEAEQKQLKKEAKSPENEEEDYTKIDSRSDADVRKKAEQEAKRIGHRNDKHHNPMDFVKQIADDITQKLMGNQIIDQPTEESSLVDLRSKTDEEVATNNDVDSDKVEGSGNISLQAVSQYEDVEGDSHKGKSASQEKTKLNDLASSKKLSRSKSRSRSHSRTRQDWRKNQRASLTSPERRRKKSRTRSKDRGHSRPRHRSESSDRHHRRRSGDRRKRSRDRYRSRSKGKRSRSRGRRSRSRDRRSRSRGRRSRSRDRRSRSRGRRSRSKDHRSKSRRGASRDKSQDRRKPRLDRHSRSRSKEKQERAEETESRKDNDVGTGDLRKFIDPGSDDEKKKQVMPSQVQVFTDFKRKPSLSKRLQASSALLKKAVTAAVSDQTEASVPQNKEEQEEIELDYTEIEDVLHKSTTDDVAMGSMHSKDRKVVLDDVGYNLATITVNIKGGTDSKHDNRHDNHTTDAAKRSSSRQSGKSDSDRRNHKQSSPARNYRKDNAKSSASSNEEETNLRRGLLDDMSKVDARYAIFKSRLDTETKKKRNEKRAKYMGSMIADLEEKSHKRKHDEEKSIRLKRTREIAQQQRRMDLRRNHLRRRAESSDEEEDSSQRKNELRKETERITQRESNRGKSSSDAGDLRNLLRNKKSLYAQDSDDENEDEIARKLREKIKEEKHKKLFGILKSEDRIRLKEEREELRRKLKNMKSRRSHHDDRQREKKSAPALLSRTSDGNDASEYSDEEETRTKKRKNEVRHPESKSNRDDEVDDIGLDKQSSADEEDEWVETQTTESFHQTAEISDVAETPAADQIKEKENEERNEVTEEPDHHNGEQEGGEHHEEAQGQEESQEKSTDTSKVITDENESTVSQETLMSSMHQDKESSSSFENTDDEERIEEKEEQFDENKTRKRVQKVGKKSKHKSKKRRHEFVVTLDGFDGGKRLSITAAAPSRRRTRSNSAEKTRSHRRRVSKRDAGNAQEDEELDVSSKEREKLEENTKRKKMSREHRHRRHRKHSNDNKEELSAIDKEILLAEKKLEAQKLLKKSLDQVQSLNTAGFSNFKMESMKPKTAFINPHFLAKTALTSLDTAQSQLQTVGLSLPASVAGNDTNIQASSSNTDESNTSHPPSTSSTTSASTSITTQSNFSSSDKSLLSPASDKVTNKVNLPPHAPVVHGTAPMGQATIQERCIYWPDCKNKTCHYIHPTTPCNMFPKCAYGERCLYIHPVCKFGGRCSNNECIYSHTGTGLSYQSQTCKFGSKCTNMECLFKHPILKPCRFGSSCVKPDCLFLHDKPIAVVNPSQLKWVADKPHVSERKFAVDESVVSNTPVALDTVALDTTLNSTSVSLTASNTQ